MTSNTAGVLVTEVHPKPIPEQTPYFLVNNGVNEEPSAPKGVPGEVTTLNITVTFQE